jgi:hypothetical protein
MTEEQARRRFMALNLVRLAAIGLVMAGVANVGGKLLPDFAPGLGAVLLVVGMIDFFFAPMMLKRFWQKQDK